MATSFKFIPQTIRLVVEGRPRKRFRTACNPCRVRKKRCSHQTPCSTNPAAPLSHKESVPRFLEPVTAGTYETTSRDPDEQASSHRINKTDHDTETNATSNQSEKQTAPSMSQAQPTRWWDTRNDNFDLEFRQSLAGFSHDGPCSTGSALPGVISVPSPPDTSSIASLQPPSMCPILPETPVVIQGMGTEVHLVDHDTPLVPTSEVSSNEAGDWLQQSTSDVCIATQNHPLSTTQDQHQFAAPLLSPLSPLSPWSVSETNISEIVCLETIIALSDIYFEKVHSLLPILNEKEYRQSLVSGSLPEPLAHVTCLVAAKSKAAEPHIRLLRPGVKDGFVSTTQFCSKIYESLVIALNGRPRMPKLDIIRAMALMSLHQEGPDGGEQASSYSTQAIHRAQSLGIHLHHREDPNSELKRTFWCLWTLDRLMAVMHSRPCITSDRDCSVEPLTQGQSESVAFDIMLRIAKTLNEAIANHRPSSLASVTCVEHRIVGFEQIIDEAKGWDLETFIIDTLYIFYLTTIVLYHKPKTMDSSAFPSVGDRRQQLPAMKIVMLLRDPARFDSVSPLPIVTFATSLALSVSYQHFQHGQVVEDQEHARIYFEIAYGISQELRHKWTSAEAISLPGLRISTEFSRAADLDSLFEMGD